MSQAIPFPLQDLHVEDDRAIYAAELRDDGKTTVITRDGQNELEYWNITLSKSNPRWALWEYQGARRDEQGAACVVWIFDALIPWDHVAEEFNG